jgi:alkylhydroperoxidase family enzyme
VPLIPYPDFDQLPPKARDYWDNKVNAKLNILRMLANADTLMEPALRYGSSILSKQALAADLRELVILLAAKLEGGEYEWNQHVPIGLDCGCSQAKIDAISAMKLDDGVFSAAESALLAFAAQVTEKVKADEEVVLAAAKHFSPKELVETVLTCGFYMTMARITETFRVEDDVPAGLSVLPSMKR